MLMKAFILQNKAAKAGRKKIECKFMVCDFIIDGEANKNAEKMLLIK